MTTPAQGSQGGNTSSVEYSPAASKRARHKRKAFQRRYEALCGPVTVRSVADDVLTSEDGRP